MGIIKALSDSIGGTISDQWKEIIVASSFDEHTAVTPGILKTSNRGRGNNMGSEGIITNKSKIFVPENTAAFIFSQSAIENIILTPGSYEYLDGQKSIFNGDSFGSAIFKEVKDRVGYGGISDEHKRVAYVNLREIRNIKFGTKGPQVYNDLFYGVDLEIYSYGSFTIKITDPEKFIRNFVPANVSYYSFRNPKVRSQMLSEFLQSFSVALNSMSTNHRISHLPTHANEISKRITEDVYNAGTWKDRFGFEVIKVAIENIEFSPESRELVKQFSSNKMNLKAYDDVSKKASDIAAQQKIAEGVRENGLGDGGGMIYGMNLAQKMSSQSEASSTMSFDQQIEAVKKLKDLLEAGILTNEEFNQKKKEVMGL